MGFLLALAVLAVPVAAPQRMAPDDLQPYTRTSPDGGWTLAVDPSDRTGRGPATYRATHAGVDVWSGEKPWTFWDALITDDGLVAGYAYSQGGPAMVAKGEFHAVILAPDGSVRLDEPHLRESSRFLHTPPNPLALGLFQHAGLKRVVLRIADPDVNRHSEEWWCYQLPEAKQVFRKRPRDVYPKAGDAVLAVRELRGTPLLLVEWRTFAWPLIGFRCVLHDADLEPVWDSGLLESLNGRDDASEPILDALRERGSLLDEPGDGRFAVGLPKKGEKVRYAAERTGEGWSVREIGREPWSFDSKEQSVLPRFETLPVTPLVSRGTFDLEGPRAEPSAVRDVLAFDCSVPDVLRVVRSENGGGFTLLRVDPKGQMLQERRVELPDALPDLRPAFWTLGRWTWLATQSPYGEGAQSRAWRIDEQAGTATRLTEFVAPAIDQVCALGEGRFVVLATYREKYTMHDALLACDAEGRRLWQIDEDMNSKEPSSLFSPEAIAVTSEGLVAVVDVIRHTLQRFDAQGAYKGTTQLDEAWGRKANYPSGVQADLDGGVLVHDFNGEPPLYRMGRDGSVRAKVVPRFPDGKVEDGLTRQARVAPDGRIWATDGQRLLRLDEQGVVDLQVGAKKDPDVLAEPSASAIDVFGRALVQDHATGSVHVFDGKGKRLFVCRPDPKDFARPSVLGCLAATRDRGVVAQVKDGRRFIRFGPDGARRGELELPERASWYAPSPTADGGYASRAFSGEGFVKVGEDGERGASFDRAPDGSWLQNAARVTVGPDGAVVVAARAGTSFPEGTRALVLFETGDPEVARTILLPQGTPSSYVNAGRKWFAVYGFKDEGLLVSRAGAQRQRFRVPDVSAGGCRLGFDPGTDELLALDAQGRKIHRFALP